MRTATANFNSFEPTRFDALRLLARLNTRAHHQWLEFDSPPEHALVAALMSTQRWATKKGWVNE